jgi:addiction module RelB/DinJ family antitoxin
MTTVVSLKLDQDIKDEATKLAKSVGLTLSSVINSYLTQIIASRRIELFAPEQMTPYLEELIGKVDKSISDGNLSKGFNNVEDFIADLRP